MVRGGSIDASRLWRFGRRCRARGDPRVPAGFGDELGFRCAGRRRWPCLRLQSGFATGVPAATVVPAYG